MASTQSSQSAGKLMAVGGAEDKEGECLVLKEFIRLARGARARVVLMTVASDHVREAGAEYRKVFKKLGVDDLRVVDVSAREDALDEKRIAAVEQATGIYFTGGDQLHITSLLGGTPLVAALRRRHEAGFVLGGTSAGAAMMSNSMFVSGESNTAPRFGCVEPAPGMDFIVGAAIDTHFSQRGRIGRLITASPTTRRTSASASTRTRRWSSTARPSRSSARAR